MKKRMSIVLVVCMVVMAFAACAPTAPVASEAPDTSSEAPSAEESAASDSPEVAEVKDNSEYTIVMVAKHEGISWFDDMRIGVDEFAQTTGVNAYQIAPEGGDPAKQVQMVEDLIAQGVDAICVVPNDTKSMSPVLQKARDAGIVVIGHEAPDILDSVDYDLEAFPNEEQGIRFGENLAKAMNGEGKYASFVGMLTMTPHMIWWENAVKYCEENYPDMECITPEPLEDKNDNKLAYDKALEILKANPDLKGFTDSAASGAGIAQMLQDKQRTDIAVVSTAVPSMSGAYIKDGYMYAGLCWRPADAGYVSCEIALKLLKGESIEEGMDFSRDGYQDIRLMDGNMLVGDAPLVLTPENIDQYTF